MVKRTTRIVLILVIASMGIIAGVGAARIAQGTADLAGNLITAGAIALILTAVAFLIADNRKRAITPPE